MVNLLESCLNTTALLTGDTQYGVLCHPQSCCLTWIHWIYACLVVIITCTAWTWPLFFSCAVASSWYKSSSLAWFCRATCHIVISCTSSWVGITSLWVISFCASSQNLIVFAINSHIFVVVRDLLLSAVIRLFYSYIQSYGEKFSFLPKPRSRWG